MSHHHLAFKLFYGFKRNTDNDDERSTAERKSHRLVDELCEDRQDVREKRNNRKEERTEKRDS